MEELTLALEECSAPFVEKANQIVQSINRTDVTAGVRRRGSVHGLVKLALLTGLILAISVMAYHVAGRWSRHRSVFSVDGMVRPPHGKTRCTVNWHVQVRNKSTTPANTGRLATKSHAVDKLKRLGKSVLASAAIIRLALRAMELDQRPASTQTQQPSSSVYLWRPPPAIPAS